MFRTIAIVAVASVALSGCITSRLAKMTPTEQVALINAAAEAGCSGQLNFGIHGSTAAGVSLGSAGGDFTFSGGCDPSKARVRVLTLKDLTPAEINRLAPAVPSKAPTVGDMFNPPH